MGYRRILAARDRLSRDPSIDLAARLLRFMTTPPPFSLGMLDDLVGFRLRLANATALRQLDASLADQGMTTAMFGTLEVLAQNERVAQGLVAEALGLNRSTMVPIIEKLHDKGWLVRERTPEDRRTVLLRLTEDGRRAARHLRRVVGVHEAHLREALGEIDYDNFMQGLRRLSEL